MCERLKKYCGHVLYLNRSKCQHYCKQRRPHTFRLVILKKDRKITLLSNSLFDKMFVCIGTFFPNEYLFLKKNLRSNKVFSVLKHKKFPRARTGKNFENWGAQKMVLKHLNKQIFFPRLNH